MLVGRVLEVGAGGPVAALQTFLTGLLRASGAASLLAPVEVGPGRVQPQVVPQGAVLSQVNPLLPLMQADAAAALRTAVWASPAGPMIAVLRPCEVHAASEMARQGKLDRRQVIVVGMDCLSTYEPAYWSQGNQAHEGNPDWLADEALKLAELGQVPAQGCRQACELCDRPAADYRAADVLVGLIGVRNKERLLILADEEVHARWGLEALTDRAATERETVDREVTLWRLADRRKGVAAASLESLGLTEARRPAIMGHLGRCTLCGKCIDACPQWSEEMRAALRCGREAFLQALLDVPQRQGCSGCGTCQMDCPQGIPLSAIQRALSLQVGRHKLHVGERNLRGPVLWTS